METLKSILPTPHELAIKAIREYSAVHAYGSYEEAVDKMLPIYEAAPELLAALNDLLFALEHFQEFQREYMAAEARAKNALISAEKK